MQIHGVMSVRVIYPNPAVLSSFWLQEILREQLSLDEVIFSDYLGMKEALVVGGYKTRGALKVGMDGQ